MHCYQCQQPLGPRFVSGFAPEIEFCSSCYDQIADLDQARFSALVAQLVKRDDLALQRQQQALTREQAIEGWIFYG